MYQKVCAKSNIVTSSCETLSLQNFAYLLNSVFNLHASMEVYYPILFRRVQITRETSTNITRYLYSSYSPDRAKDQKPWQVRIVAKRKCWIINLLLDILVCSIAVNFYSSFAFWLVKYTAILDTKMSNKIYVSRV